LAYQRDAIQSINEAKDKIVSIKKKLEEKNNGIPSLEELKVQFDNIYCVLGEKRFELQKGLKGLNSTIDKIKRYQCVHLNENIVTMLEVIRANLPRGMIIEEENNSIKQGILKYEDKPIGDLKIREEDNKIIIDVSIINTKLASFHVEHVYGVYTIINHILTKFNYD